MKFKGKIIHMRKSRFLKFSTIILSTTILVKLLSFINVEDWLYDLANNEKISNAIINDALSNTLPSFSSSQLILSQSTLITQKEHAKKSENYTPWKLQKKSENSLPVKSLSVNPISPKGYVNSGKVFIKNSTSTKIDLNKLLNSAFPFNIKDNGVQVLIIHTHGSESYLPTPRNYYTPDDVDRTLDTKHNVVRVGDEIESILKTKGIAVIHDRNIYDSPSYNGSYTRALNSITNHMKKNPSIRVILDIHRDSICGDDGTKYRTLAKINGEDCAQLMLVLSTGESGLPHPNWEKNLIFGAKLQGQIANKYPGLMRPINLRKERFNMHVSSGSLLVEVGSTGNTLEEALRAVRPFSEELATLLLSVKK